MKILKVLTFFVLFLITLEGFAPNNNLTNILDGIFQQQDIIDEQISDAIFLGKFSYVETNAAGDTLKTINSLRRIYSKSTTKQKSEYLEMVIDGKKLSKPQIDKQTKRNQSNQNFKLPFYKKFRNEYDFFYVSEDQEAKIWVIGFNPKNKKEGYLKGTAEISQADFSIQRLHFLPTDLPAVVKKINITLDYAKYGNYSLPSIFNLEMEINVKVIFNLAHKFIKMQEVYWDYQFNNNLPDSIFDS